MLGLLVTLCLNGTLGHGVPALKIFGVAFFIGIVGGIWYERNRRIFDSMKRNHLEVTDSLLFEVASWSLKSNEFCGFSLIYLLKDYSLCVSFRGP